MERLLLEYTKIVSQKEQGWLKVFSQIAFDHIEYFCMFSFDSFFFSFFLSLFVFDFVQFFFLFLFLFLKQPIISILVMFLLVLSLLLFLKKNFSWILQVFIHL